MCGGSRPRKKDAKPKRGLGRIRSALGLGDQRPKTPVRACGMLSWASEKHRRVQDQGKAKFCPTATRPRRRVGEKACNNVVWLSTTSSSMRSWDVPQPVDGHRPAGTDVISISAVSFSFFLLGAAKNCFFGTTPPHKT